jgi:hypothetical protein
VHVAYAHQDKKAAHGGWRDVVPECMPCGRLEVRVRVRVGVRVRVRVRDGSACRA